jgi:hypothetical protein
MAWVRARRASLALLPQRPRQDERRTGAHVQPCDLAIAVAAVLPGKLDNIGRQTLFVNAKRIFRVCR